MTVATVSCNTVQKSVLLFIVPIFVYHNDYDPSIFISLIFPLCDYSHHLPLIYIWHNKPNTVSAQHDIQSSDYPIYDSVDWVAPLSPISLCVVLQWLPLVTMALFLSPLWWQWQSFQLFCSHKQWSQSTLLTMGVSLEAVMDCCPFKQWKRSNKERRQQKQ